MPIFALACLVCVGLARRLQDPEEGSSIDAKESLASILFALQPTVGFQPHVGPAIPHHRAVRPPRMSEQLAVGSKFPAVELMFGFPPEKIDMAERVKDKRVIVVGLPGAFTPT